MKFWEIMVHYPHGDHPINVMALTLEEAVWNVNGMLHFGSHIIAAKEIEKTTPYMQFNIGEIQPEEALGDNWQIKRKIDLIIHATENSLKYWEARIDEYPELARSAVIRASSQLLAYQEVLELLNENHSQ